MPSLRQIINYQMQRGANKASLLTDGSLSLSAAASQVVPGATSLSLRNHGNTRDDLIILNETWGGGVGIGGTASGNSALQVTGFDQATVGGAAALNLQANGRSVAITDTTDWALLSNGTFFDTVDIFHYSAGDGVYVEHHGGLKPGGNSATGADTSFNTLIPYYRTLTNGAVLGRTGTTINNYTGMCGFKVDFQPVTSGTAIAIRYSGSDEAIALVNNDNTYAQGNGLAMLIQNYGTNSVIKIDHHEGTAPTFTLNCFDAGGSRSVIQATLSGEAYSRLTIRYDGAIFLGSGAIAQDVVLSRSNAAELTVNNTLRLVQATGNSASRTFTMYTIGDAANAFTMTAIGTMSWGPRTSGADTNLYRAGVGILKTDNSLSVGGATIQGHATAAINATATATAAQVTTGYITSTSAAPTTITLPTGTLLGAALGAVQGTIFELYIDNTAGANTVTIAVAVNGILSADAVANAGSLGLLTVPSGVTGQARFTLMFSSATAYTFSRTG